MCSTSRGASLVAIMLSACATDATDPRPETADYIVEAILAPACGRGACHSSETNVSGIALDTIAAAKASMLGTGGRDRVLVVPGSPDSSLLVTILTDTGKPMPADAPLPQVDIDLITSWVANGAVGLQ